MIIKTVIRLSMNLRYPFASARLTVYPNQAIDLIKLRLTLRLSSVIISASSAAMRIFINFLIDFRVGYADKDCGQPAEK